jgi:hypothetical protein
MLEFSPVICYRVSADFPLKSGIRSRKKLLTLLLTARYAQDAKNAKILFFTESERTIR